MQYSISFKHTHIYINSIYISYRVFTLKLLLHSIKFNRILLLQECSYYDIVEKRSVKLYYVHDVCMYSAHVSGEHIPIAINRCSNVNSEY